jgi:hypothetical protein
MIETYALTEVEFKATFAAPMRNVTDEGGAMVDIWPYVDALDLDELGVPHLNDIHYVYRDSREWFDQILIGTGRFNALLVIVVDRRSFSILGHCLLDLNQDYGVTGGHLKIVR